MTFPARCAAGIDAISAWALLAVVAVVLVVVSAKTLHSPIDYDEGYNLQVVDNLAKGIGYASYGAIRDAKPWPFDPDITTGPAILMPMAVFWKLTGGSILAVRIFMIALFWAYLAGVYRLWSGQGRPLLAAAAAMASTLCFLYLPMGRLVGEISAAAAIVWSAWAVARDRPILAGLLAGIAVQIKFVYGLAGAVLIVGYLAVLVAQRPPGWLRTSLWAVVAPVIPTAAFELYRLCCLGDLRAYGNSLWEFHEFLRGQSLSTNHLSWHDPARLGFKLEGAWLMLPHAAWAVIGIAILTLLATATLDALRRSDAQGVPSPAPQDAPAATAAITSAHDRLRASLFAMAMFALAVGGLLMLLGWLVLSAQPSQRQGLPFMLFFFPAVTGLAACCYAQLAKRIRSTAGALLLRAPMLLCVALLIAGLCHKAFVTTHAKLAEHAREQLQIAALIRASGAKSIWVDRWWQDPEFLVLSGVPGLTSRTAEPQLYIVTDIEVEIDHLDWEQQKPKFARIIYQSPMAMVGFLPPPVPPAK